MNKKTQQHADKKMVCTRRDFLKHIGLGTTSAAMLPLMQSCAMLGEGRS
ncbi:MAG: twin-arginine translocation signal domain-containing protein, partial [Planctomycetota bacterium]